MDRLKAQRWDYTEKEQMYLSNIHIFLFYYSYHIISYHIILYYIVLYWIILYHMALYDLIWYGVILRYIAYISIHVTYCANL